MRELAMVVASVALIASSCSDSSAEERSATVPVGNTGSTAPARSASSSAPTTDAATTVDSSTTAGPSIPIGAWGWSPPCRVRVDESVSSQPDGLSVRRTYVVDVSADSTGDGYLVRFEDVAVDTDLTDQAAALLLLEANAVLPALRLDATGNFAEFVDLGEVFTVAAEAAGVPISPVEADTLAASPEAEEGVRFNTVDSWYGYWSNRTTVADAATTPPAEPGLRHVGFTPYETEVVVAGSEAAGIPVGVPGTPPPGSVELVRYEGSDDTLLDVMRQAGLPDRIDRVEEALSVTTTLDPTNLRPSQVNRSNSMLFWGTDEESFARTEALLLSTFDWDTAEGCVGG